ncbi:MAG: NRDE family protein [Saprospiraceae bacterium]
MCTVTYLPLRAGFVLTHNRDEAPARNAHKISRERSAGDVLLFPRDAKAGGAWFVASKSGKTACLLNGAFEKHRHEPPYRRSRGLMLLDFFEFGAPDDFFGKYDLAGIEPFTFLFFARDRVVELRWDGSQKHLKSLPPDVSHFWCSSTLYPAEMRERREQVFRNWLTMRQKDEKSLPADVLKLHLTGSVGDPENDFVMNRAGRVCTVSVTQIVRNDDRLRMKYRDLLDGQRDVRNMTLAADL